MKSIYISPSNQTPNLYYDKSHNEAEVMERVARALAAKLAAYEVKVYLRERNKPTSERMSEANGLAVDYYLSIHSNAGGGRGAECFHQIGVDKSAEVKANSLAFAIKVLRQIAAITPSNANALDRGLKPKQQSDGRDWNMELRGCKMPAILIEVEFHDTPAGSTWILANVNNIAEALKKAVVEQMGLTLKVVPAPVPAPVTFKVGDRVRINLSATTYTTGQKIPLWVKLRTHTIQQIGRDRNLLKEIYSWVFTKDIKKA